MNVLKISIISILVALCVATNYALVGIYNVKAMDFIVFIGGFSFGPLAGALIGILSWTVYGAINPYGFVPQVWLATMLCEPIYGVAGGLVGRNLCLADLNGRRIQVSMLFGFLGFVSTLIYDMITNIVYAMSFDIPIIAALSMGTPFTVMHELSNTAIFVVGSVPLIMAVKKMEGSNRVEFFRK